MSLTSRIPRWERDIELLPSGHRLFTKERISGEPKRVAIADESGVYPQDTDDGILWLNYRNTGSLGRPLSIGYNATDERWYCIVPVLDNDDNERAVTVDPSTLLRLAIKFDWLILDVQANERYRISRR